MALKMYQRFLLDKSRDTLEVGTPHNVPYVASTGVLREYIYIYPSRYIQNQLFFPRCTIDKSLFGPFGRYPFGDSLPTDVLNHIKQSSLQSKHS